MLDTWRLKKLLEAIRQNAFASARRCLKLPGRPVVNELGPDGLAPVHASIQAGSARLLHLLLSHGADPSLKDGEGRTPVHHCAMKVSSIMANLLVAKGADINAKDPEGSTPLHLLVKQRPRCNVVVDFLSMGANMNLEDSRGHTPMSHAAEMDLHEVLAFLMLGIAEVNREDGAGWTDLHLAAWSDASGAAQLYLGQGADPNRKTPDGHTPFDLTSEHSRAEQVLANVVGRKCAFPQKKPR